jgi:hypothetical protein
MATCTIADGIDIVDRGIELGWSKATIMGAVETALVRAYDGLPEDGYLQAHAYAEGYCDGRLRASEVSP